MRINKYSKLKFILCTSILLISSQSKSMTISIGSVPEDEVTIKKISIINDKIRVKNKHVEKSKSVPKSVSNKSVDKKYNYLDKDVNKSIQRFIFNKSKVYDINPMLIFAIMEKESKFDEDAISYTNDYGICQINSSNFNWINQECGYELNYMNSKDNILGCMTILNYLYKKYPDRNDNYILMCYNGGENYANNLNNQGIYSTEYSRDVLDIYKNNLKSFEKSIDK